MSLGIERWVERALNDTDWYLRLEPKLREAIPMKMP